MTVPLVSADSVLGSVTIASAGSGRRFGPDDVALAEELAERVALVVAKERRYDSERVISHTLQNSLLPAELPAIDGLRFSVRYLAGTADAEVGGDFWDVLSLPDGNLAIAVGDVAGHDITAAATMARLRSLPRAAHADHQPRRVGQDHSRQLGTVWPRPDRHRRVRPTAATTGNLRIASAGHLAPLIVEPDRAWFPAIEPAAPLGSPVPGTATLWHGHLPPGATVVFYTDGLVEDRHREIDEGTGRLIRAAMASPSREPDRLVAYILAALSGDARADDVAILAVQRVV